MILLSIETGMRVGELCSLKWDDIMDDYIHIHTQQREIRSEGKIDLIEIPWTKDEKGVSRGGRFFPMTDRIYQILTDLKKEQINRSINATYVFTREDGSWVPTRRYEDALSNVCKNLKLEKTNNHALRMTLNSNILIPKGMPETIRAKLLGHSVETNLNYYSFESKGYVKESLLLLNA